MSGTQVSSFYPVNQLLADNAQQIQNYYAPQRNQLLMQEAQQRVGANEIEYAARAAAGLLSLNDEAAMAAAYPGAIAEGQRYGFLKNAPAAFPGVDRLRQIASMGVSAKDLLETTASQRAKQMMVPTDSGTPTGNGTTAAPGAGTGHVATLTPFVGANLPTGVTPEQDQLVRTVYGEANGQPLAGQQAVAHVVLNRAKGSGETIEQVIFKPHQFEPWNTGRRAQLEALDPNSPDYQRILNTVVRPVLAGQAPDPTGGATHFLNPALVTSRGDQIPGWASGDRTTIGQHDFYYAPYGGGQRGGVAARTGGTNVASVTSTTATDATPAPVPAATPAVPLPQAEAVATAARTGQSVPIQNGNGLMAHPDGNIGPPRPAASPVASAQPPTQSQAPAQQELPPLPPLQIPPRLEANGYTTSQNRAIKAAQEDPKVSTEQFQTMLKGFASQNQSATDKALEHNMSIQRELRERVQNAQQQQNQARDYQLRLEAANRAVEEAQRQRETHQRAMETQGVPTGYRRNPQTGQDEPDPGYKGALKEGFQWDPNNPGKQIFVEGGPADPKVIAAQDAARRTGGRVMGETERTKLIEQAGLVDATGRLSSTFKPDFAGFFSGSYGDFRNWVAAQTPGESPRADWWKEYQRTNVLGQRHAIAGASMTPTEQAEYAKADINPGMSPETIIQNLAVQQRILETARNRRVKAMAAEGYNKDAITAAAGVDPDEVTAPTSKTQQGQPLNVRPDARPPLTSFQR